MLSIFEHLSTTVSLKVSRIFGISVVWFLVVRVVLTLKPRGIDGHVANILHNYLYIHDFRILFS